MENELKDKKNEDVSRLFDEISHKYDFLNHFLSFGIDRSWRKKMIKLIRKEQPLEILDVATGTADLAIYAALYINNSHIRGIDISKKMLEIGERKTGYLNLRKQIELIHIPAEKMTFGDSTFDAAMVAFGVRNFECLECGIGEMLRVIKPGKKVFILEFSKPRGLFKPLYMFYFKVLLPLFGRLISKNRSAYSYLRDSVIEFPDDKDFLKILEKCGCSNASQKRLSGGIATIYVGQK